MPTYTLSGKMDGLIKITVEYSNEDDVAEGKKTAIEYMSGFLEPHRLNFNEAYLAVDGADFARIYSDPVDNKILVSQW